MKDAIRPFEAFPGWQKYPDFVAGYVSPDPGISVLDLGGGANPMLPRDLAAQVDYDLLDIDPGELKKASSIYTSTICTDAAGDSAEFARALGGRRYNVVFSHMLLEHVTRPDDLHRNVFSALKPGGHAIHAFPVNRNLPLMLNSLVPEPVSKSILRVIQPERRQDGLHGKFPAHYAKCMPPSERARDYFEGLGFEVEEHVGFAGHEYYRRVPGLRTAEHFSRRFAVAWQLSWTCFSLLVLSRPEAEASAA